MGQTLLDAADYRLIDQFRLASRKRVTGSAPGEQRSPAQGGGIEFADYKEYLPGDDPRRVDWMLFLRWRKLFVKLAAEEKELTLVVLLDNSASMTHGSPEKLRFAKRLAAVLSGIVLGAGNRVGVYTWGSSLREVQGQTRSRQSFSRMVEGLERVVPVKKVAYKACIRQFSARFGGRCKAVLLSDLLFPEWKDVVAGLAGAGEAHVIQILSPSERDPEISGEVTLVDSETDAELALHIDAPLVARYKTGAEAFLGEVSSSCRKRGLGWNLLTSDLELREALNHKLRGGLVS